MPSRRPRTGAQAVGCAQALTVSHGILVCFACACLHNDDAQTHPAEARLHADELHDLVLALARHVVAAVNDAQLLPFRVARELVAHEEAQVAMQAHHEGRSRRNAVRVEEALGWELLADAARLGLRLRARGGGP
jgi:hypothetical protein